jgi:long-chain fatty acid transport protein
VNKTVISLQVACAIAILSASTHAGAAAFALYEHGASGLGNAFAGAAAVAEDASTVWWNPAGMARLPSGRHLAVAGNVVSPSTEFSNSGSVAPLGRPLGGNGGDAGDTAFLPSAFFAMSFDPRWSFGLGVSVPFGLKTEYSPDWIGRFQGISSEIKTININPSVSYKVSDALSLGFGINYITGEIETLTAVNFGAGEGQNKSKVDGDAWGFNVGVLFSLSPATRLGVHYRSSVDFEMDGTTTFTGTPAAPTLANGNVELDVKTPDSLAFSVAHRMNDRLELLGDVTWWQWSKIERVPLVRTDGALAGTPVSTFVFNFDDSWRTSIGANYKLDAAWMLKLGFAYDQTPVPSAEERTVRLPDSDRYWFSAGAKYQMSRSGALDFGYTFIKADDADIRNNQGTGLPPGPSAGFVSGSYEAEVHIFGIQYQHSF